jgi:hypothetical protein
VYNEVSRTAGVGSYLLCARDRSTWTNTDFKGARAGATTNRQMLVMDEDNPVRRRIVRAATLGVMHLGSFSSSLSSLPRTHFMCTRPTSLSGQQWLLPSTRLPWILFTPCAPGECTLHHAFLGHSLQCIPPKTRPLESRLASQNQHKSFAAAIVLRRWQ